MTAEQQLSNVTANERERIRLVEVDYDHTNDFIKSVVSTAATLRGVGITIWLGLLGFAVEQDAWELAALAGVIAVVFFFLDGYHSWLYAEAAKHARAAEKVTSRYYDALSRGEDDAEVMLDFREELRSHRFGLFMNLHSFKVKDLREARPRLFFQALYPMLFIVALLVVAGIATGVIGKGQGETGPPPTTTDAAALARRYAPVLALDQAELFLPIDRDRYLQAANLIRVRSRYRKELIPYDHTDAGLLEKARLCLTPSHCYLKIAGLRPSKGPHCYAALEIRLIALSRLLPALKGFRAGTPRARRWCRPTPITQWIPRIGPATVYWHVVTGGPSGEATVQYWFLYLFNGFRFNWHEADWEEITVLLDSQNQPITAYYSSHVRGHEKPWAAVERDREHPVVYVADASHANYFQPGDDHRVPITCVRKVCISAPSSVTDTADGCGAILLPRFLTLPPKAPATCPRRLRVTYILQPLSGGGFNGVWSNRNYIVPRFSGLKLVCIPFGSGPKEPQRRGAEWRKPWMLFLPSQCG